VGGGGGGENSLTWGETEGQKGAVGDRTEGGGFVIFFLRERTRGGEGKKNGMFSRKKNDLLDIGGSFASGMKKQR